jgi:hypothetical protein
LELLTNYIVEGYKSTETYLVQMVTQETLCHEDCALVYLELPIHKDPFVHLLPELHAIV